MMAVKLQHHSIICTSPGGHEGKGVGIKGGLIDNEESVWTKESRDIWDEEW